jgi:hypothetical protein
VPVIPKGEFFENVATLMAIRGAMISPDDEWPALQMKSRDGSGGSVVFLKRADGLRFNFLPGQFFAAADPHTNMDPATDACEMALKANGIHGDTLDVTDHTDLVPIEWSGDSKWIVVSLNASGTVGGKRVRITDARFRYFPVTHLMEPVRSIPGKVETHGR